MRKERSFDQIVVNHGTVPLDDLYFDLKPLSRNRGAISHGDLIARRPQAVADNPGGAFQLFRIGDAVAARNTHAAIYGALRPAKDLSCRPPRSLTATRHPPAGILPRKLGEWRVVEAAVRRSRIDRHRL